MESDAELVAAALTGRRDAFAALVERHRSTVVALCRRIVRDPGSAEDVAQEAILQALLGLEKLREPDRFSAWLIGIAINTGRQWVRAGSREASQGELIWRPVSSNEESSQVHPEELLLASELGARVREAVDQLPAGQREVVILYYLEDLDQAESAARLGINESAVKTRLQKARNNLRGRLRTVWEDEHMEQARAAGYVDARVADVWRQRTGPNRHVLLLQEVGSERILPIWVGPGDGVAVARLIQRSRPERPLSHDFTASLLEVMGAQVKEVRVTALRGGTYFSEVTLNTSTGEASVDARPSDAISLALTVGASIRVDTRIFDVVGFPTLEAATSQWGPRALGSESRYDRVDRIVSDAELFSAERRQFAAQRGELDLSVPATGA